MGQYCKGGQKNMPKNAVLNIAKDYISAVKKNGVSVSSAYLFGSYAKHNAHDGSDIDICVISSDLGRDIIDETMMLGKMTLKVDSRIEPHPMSPIDFAEKYNLLAHEVKTYGIKIV